MNKIKFKSHAEWSAYNNGISSVNKGESISDNPWNLADDTLLSLAWEKGWEFQTQVNQYGPACVDSGD